MKRTILISTGVILMLLGMCYSVFWGQAIREAGSLFSAGQAQNEEAVREQSPCFVRAVRLLGVDIFAPAMEESPGSPADLARRISRGMYTHFAIGILAVLAGTIVLVAGLHKRKAPPEHEDTTDG
jgi:hypothetical protein